MRETTEDRPQGLYFYRPGRVQPRKSWTIRLMEIIKGAGMWMKRAAR